LDFQPLNSALASKTEKQQLKLLWNPNYNLLDAWKLFLGRRAQFLDAEITKLDVGQLFNSPHNSIGCLAGYFGRLVHLLDAR